MATPGALREDSDGLRSMEFLEDQPRVTRLSPYRLAPEMVGGVPTGHANSVWALGIILARLTLGYVPTMPHGDLADGVSGVASGYTQVMHARGMIPESSMRSRT